MIGLDTNVIARIVLADDPAQTRQAMAVLTQARAAGEAVVLALPTLLELEWVLRTVARLPKANVLHVFKSLLETQDLQIDQEEVLEQALYAFEAHSADFGECLFAAQYQRMGCRTMLTFDKKAGRLEGVEWLGAV